VFDSCDDNSLQQYNHISSSSCPLSTRLTDLSNAALAAAVEEAPVCSPRVELDDEPHRGGDRGQRDVFQVVLCL
jgi:hypothetical protein